MSMSAPLIEENNNAVISEQLMRRSRRFSVSLAFVIPVLILWIAYASRGIWPIMGRQILTVDLYHQYAPFLEMLREKVANLNFSSYSFGAGLGMNFLGVFWYYLASPFNVIYLAFPKEFLSEAILVITLLKVGFASVAFQVFVHRFFKRTGKLSVAFASTYALSSFFIAYGWNIMWLDTLIVLPVLVWLLVNGFSTGRFLSYAALVTVTICLNYYMAFFVAIFSIAVGILCFVDSICKQGKIAFWRLVSWLFYSVLGVGMAAVVIAPVAYVLGQTASFDGELSFPGRLVVPFLDLVYRHFPFLPPVVRSGLPNLFTSTIVLLLVPVFLLSRRISMRQKIMATTLLGLLLLSFNHSLLNLLWHGGHAPNQLPHRFAFLYVFVVLVVAYSALPSLRELSRKTIWGIIAVISLLVLVLEKSGFDKVSSLSLYLGILILVIYAIAISSMHSPKWQKSFPMVLSLIILIELLANTVIGIARIDSTEFFTQRSGYGSGEQVTSIEAAKLEIVKAETDKYYRIEILPNKTANDPALYGLPGVTLFSSTMPKGQTNWFKAMGFSTNGVNSVQYNGQTEFANALLGVKYLIHRKPLSYALNPEKSWLHNEMLEIEKTPKLFGLGFAVSNDVLKTKSNDRSVFANQNHLANQLGAKSDLLAEHHVVTDNANQDYKSNKKVTYSSFETAEAGEYFIALEHGDKASSISATYGDKTLKLAPLEGIQNLGVLPAKTTIKLNFELTEENSASPIKARVASQDRKALYSLIETKQSEALQIETFASGKIVGKIVAKEDGYLLLSIPYDEAWQVLVKGRKTTCVAYTECLMAVPIVKGENSIQMTYQPKYLETGALISAVSFACYLVLVMVVLIRRRILCKQQKRLKTIDGLLAQPATATDKTVTKSTAVTEASETTAVIE